MQAGYYCRDSLKSLLWQMFKIGYYLPDLTTGNSLGGVKLRHLAPGLFFYGHFFWKHPFLGVFFPVFFLYLGFGLLSFYIAVMVFNSMVLAFGRHKPRYLNLAYLIPAMHFAYFF